MPRSAIAGLRGAQIVMRFVAVVIAAAVLIAWACSARAAITGDSESFSASGSLDGWFPAAVTLRRFDPSLGSLTGASFTLSSSTSLTGSVDAVSKFGAAAGAASFTGFFEVIANDLGLGSVLASSLSAGATCSGQGCHGDGSNALPFLGSYGAPTPDAFVGTGDFTALLSIGIVPNLYQCSGACSIGSSIGWSGSLSVEYSYVPSGAPLRSPGVDPPSAAPEPTSLAILAMGVALVALRRRQRR